MRKMLLLPLIAVAVMASQAGAEICKVPSTATSGGGKTAYCQYSTGCYEVSTEYSDVPGTCSKPSCTCDQLIQGCQDANGAVFTDVTGLNGTNNYGDDVICKNNGGNWTGLGKDPNAASRGWCDWGDCVQDPSNDYACLDGGCFEIQNEQEETDCGTGGTKYSSMDQCPKSSLPKANGGTGGTPILSGASVAGLTVLAQNGSLHISSQKDADVSLFDMNGKQVFSQNVAKGYNTLSLNGQKQGVYFAVVSSGSSKQTVKVILK